MIQKQILNAEIELGMFCEVCNACFVISENKYKDMKIFENRNVKFTTKNTRLIIIID